MNYQHAVPLRATGGRVAALLVVAGQAVSSPFVGGAQTDRIPDVDAAMTALRFDPATSDWNGDGCKGNGIREYERNDDPTNDPFTREPGKGLKP